MPIAQAQEADIILHEPESSPSSQPVLPTSLPEFVPLPVEIPLRSILPPASQPSTQSLKIPSSFPVSLPTTSPTSVPSTTPTSLSALTKREDPTTLPEQTLLLKKKKKKPWVFAAVPVFIASSDSGIGGGIQLDLFDKRGGKKPFQAQYELIAVLSSKGFQAYAAKIDRPNLWGGQYRLSVQAAFFQFSSSLFFGVGNNVERDLVLEKEEFYEYELLYYGAITNLRRDLGDTPFSLIAQFDGRQYQIGVTPGTHLDQERPPGVFGGFSGQFGLGVLRDTRNKEAWPTKGGFDELSFRVAPSLISADPYTGATLVLRRYLNLFPRVSLAGRAAFDFLFGENVPIYEMQKFGLDAIASVGGSFSLRGLPEHRFIGKAKSLLSTELRILPFKTRIFQLGFEFGFAAFLDAGRVLGDYDESLEGLGFHLGQGVGARIFYEKTFVIRADLARSNEDNFRFYLNIGHPF